MRKSLILAVHIFFGLSGTAFADPHDPEGEAWITNITVSRATCNLKVAKKVAIEEVVRSPNMWRGRCIAVEGYWKRVELFASAADADEEGAQRRGSRLGLYGPVKRLRAGPSRARPYIAAGMVGDCEHLSKAASLGVLGYCHYHATGSYLALGEIRRR